ncbi:MAG: hypothetical protein E7348_00890 [Clostridiales bacterium]|nr:hypothetical protein [Clostridiales bacterium]
MSLELVLREDERAVFKLRELYGKYGYAPYKMSKFEEYDLYAVNKEFLVSDNVITFTDTDGKLMALKPDVTLSIIKNSKDNLDGVQKVYYDENVYRVSKGTKSFKEIMQAGLECIGDVDDYSVVEVIALAVKSLNIISQDYYLDISSLDLLNSIFDMVSLNQVGRNQMLVYLSQKNSNGVESVCQSQGLKKEHTDLLLSLVSTYGSVDKIEKTLKGFALDKNSQLELEKLVNLIKCLTTLGFDKRINIDFSVVNDLNYYNGVVFKGFVSGIPTGILSGGQYDKLMQKMNKKSKAIGFAVYLDELSRLEGQGKCYDVDIALEYGSLDIRKVTEKVQELIEQGKTVFADKKIPQNCRYKKLIKLTD